MVLGIAEDLTTKVLLDSELTDIPVSGIYANSGIHPSINVDNLLSFLPSLELTFPEWDSTKTYGKFIESNKRTDIVVKSNKIYQSIKSENTNHDPVEVGSTFWLETNIESLRIKTFLASVMRKVYSELNLTKRLIDNQYIYEQGSSLKTVVLPSNYAAWVFEPKGSDYVAIRLNQISFTKAGTTPVNLYVINQDKLVTTLTLTPSNGVIEFKNLNYTFNGKGRFIFAIDSTEVLTSLGYSDPLRYEGFVCYPAVGTGGAPESADFSFYGVTGNGMGFNVTAVLDAGIYIDNNINEFASFIRAAFEYMSFQMFLNNSNNRSNRAQVIQMTDELLKFEVLNLQGNTSAYRYEKERKAAINQLRKSFDTQLFSDTDSLEVEESAV